MNERLARVAQKLRHPFVSTARLELPQPLAGSATVKAPEPQPGQHEGPIIIGLGHVITNRLTAERLLTAVPGTEILIPNGGDVIMGGLSEIPLEQQHLEQIEEDYHPSPYLVVAEVRGKIEEAKIVAAMNAQYDGMRGTVPVVIVEQAAENGSNIAWYEAPLEGHKKGDSVLITPVTERYSDGSYCNTYRVDIKSS